MVDLEGHDLADAGTVEGDDEGVKASFLSRPRVARSDLGEFAARM